MGPGGRGGVEGDDLESPPVATNDGLSRFKDDGIPARTETAQRTEQGGSDFPDRHRCSDGGTKRVCGPGVSR